MQRNSIFNPLAKWKFVPSPRLHPQSYNVVNTHTKFNTWISSTEQIYRWPYKQLFGCVGFQEKFDWPPMKSSKTKASFRKVYSLLLTLRSRELATNLLTVNAPKMEPSYTHSCWHNNGCGLQACKVTFLQYFCQTTVWWHPSFRMALSLPSTLTNIQAHSNKLYTNK